MNFMTSGGKLQRILNATHHIISSDVLSTKRIPIKVKEPIKKVNLIQYKTQLNRYIPTGKIRITSGPCFTTQIRWRQSNSPPSPPKSLLRELEVPNFDVYRKRTNLSLNPVERDYRRKTFPYVVGFFGLLGGMYGTKSTIIHYVAFMAPSAEVWAIASIEVDLSVIPEGKTATIKWRGKPLFVKHRTAEEIAHEVATPLSILRDPEPDENRAQVPKWLIVIGICTHLGCVPVPNSGDFPGGFIALAMVAISMQRAGLERVQLLQTW